ncbi:PIG-L deacetylase family protein [Fictibacillus aquaticus]|uniref:PIG-L domain-containing protein n=1 Tax=Fictibacillus aquaticus TaxID=2021314 RepID=A0A235FEX4_9BACL|nr:PIG-L family deacetylase [Fictibacillus aquaticus]OYD59762.1 hypothetical protein CGZ90_07740 [Fictibacillus aquaticus]
MKRKVLKLAKPFILPFNERLLRKYYNQNLALSTIQSWKKILVLAPHVDDETIGLGGTILKAVQNGTEVHCLYITNGAKSVSGMSAEELMAARKNEAEQVKSVLGMKTVGYLDQPDGEVKVTDEVVRMLQEQISRIKPDVIFTTTLIDCHPDHVATARILAETLKHTSYTGEVWSYEINCPMDPEYINRVVDITPYKEKKDEALKIFRSQSIDFDGFVYLSHIKPELLGLKSGVQYAESFIALSPKEFIAAADRLMDEGDDHSHLFRQVNKTETLLLGILPKRQRKQELYRKGYLK